MTGFFAIGRLLSYLMRRLALILFAALALALVVSTGMALAGLWQWLQIDASYAGAPVENVGMYAQIGLTLFAVSLCFFFPSNRRILRLETSHRNFSVGMNDVARAYSLAHAEDRKGTFQLSSEFDSVRERIGFLNGHPDLQHLEPNLLEIAAQMSHVSRELAVVYSKEKVERARDFLKQRQEELSLFDSRLEEAKAVSNELKQWVGQVELDESVAAAQMDRLKIDLNKLLPELGLQTTVETLSDEEITNTTALDNTVVELPPKAAE